MPVIGGSIRPGQLTIPPSVEYSIKTITFVQEDAFGDAGFGRELVGPKAVDMDLHEVGLGAGVVGSCVQYVVSA
eukprot:2803073-Pyramimonas_sp.AAC.1